MDRLNMDHRTPENTMIPWHRLFGMALTDFFLDSGYEVELEVDLSLKQQLLDVVIIEKKEGGIPDPLPDGLENLAAHNLMTYKSHRESLDGWTIEELCGHYVNYRKQISPSFDDLRPADDFRLYAVSTRYPKKLSEQVTFRPIGPGVYDLRWGIRDIRVIVLSRIPESERNAPWLMFSAVPKKVKHGAGWYQWKTPVSRIFNDLLNKYAQEGVIMPYTIEDYLRDSRQQFIENLTQEDIDEILKSLDPEKVFKSFKPEDRVRGLEPEDRVKGLGLEERIKDFNPDEIEEYLKKIKQDSKS